MKINFKDYNTYKDYQILLNKNKINNIWVDDEELTIVADHINLNLDIKTLSFGVCHGSRNGYEVKKLRELLDIEIIGTDISETAANFPYMIVHDFHDIKQDWINRCDFIYTNSLDHSYDPNKFLKNNYLHLKKGGFMYIEHSDYHVLAKNDGDCFGATFDEYINLISKFYKIDRTIPVKSKVGLEQNRKIIVCKKIKDKLWI